MTSNSNSHNFEPLSSAANSEQASRLPDVMQRDRFEMVSAYLDGEVSADERRQVEEWLETDPTVQRLHTRLLRLRQAFQSMPIPTSDEQTVQQTVDAVLARVDRRPRLSVIWGGIAIAAVAVGAVTSMLVGGDRSFVPQFAKESNSENVQPSVANSESEPLLVALDKPLVSLPKTPVAGENQAPQNQVPLETNDNVR